MKIGNPQNEKGIPLDAVASGSAVGSIALFAGAELPEGYLLCDGAALSREVYAELFSAIGTTWGEGDGSTTFNLPDLRGKFIRGNGGDSADLGVTQPEGLPGITGSFSWVADNASQATASGAITRGSAAYWGAISAGNSIAQSVLNFNASRSSSVYGASDHVTPLNNSVNFIIKY